MHAKSTNSLHAAFVAVGELLAYKREPNNAVGTYCGSKRQTIYQTLSEKFSRVCHELV